MCQPAQSAGEVRATFLETGIVGILDELIVQILQLKIATRLTILAGGIANHLQLAIIGV